VISGQKGGTQASHFPFYVGALMIVAGIANLVLALVLGRMAESSFRRSMLLSQGELSVFFASPLAATLMSIGLLMLFWRPLSRLWSRRPA